MRFGGVNFFSWDVYFKIQQRITKSFCFIIYWRVERKTTCTRTKAIQNHPLSLLEQLAFEAVFGTGLNFQKGNTIFGSSRFYLLPLVIHQVSLTSSHRHGTPTHVSVKLPEECGPNPTSMPKSIWCWVINHLDTTPWDYF